MDVQKRTRGCGRPTHLSRQSLLPCALLGRPAPAPASEAHSGSWRHAAPRALLHSACVGDPTSERAARACTSVCLCECVCEREYVRARAGGGWWGSAGSPIPLGGAHPTLCLLLRLLLELRLAPGPGFRISCLFNERQKQKAGQGGGAPGCACSEGDPEHSLPGAARARRASWRPGEASSPASPEPPGARRGSQEATGKPNRKDAPCVGTPWSTPCGKPAAGSRPALGDSFSSESSRRLALLSVYF